LRRCRPRNPGNHQQAKTNNVGERARDPLRHMTKAVLEADGEKFAEARLTPN
jgi:hypothetical protein